MRGVRVRVIVGLVLIILVGSIQISYAQTKPMEYIIVKGALGDKEHLGVKLISGYTGVSITTIFEFTSWDYKRVGENLELTNNKGNKLVLNVEDALIYPKIKDTSKYYFRYNVVPRGDNDLTNLYITKEGIFELFDLIVIEDTDHLTILENTLENQLKYELSELQKDWLQEKDNSVVTYDLRLEGKRYKDVKISYSTKTKKDITKITRKDGLIQEIYVRLKNKEINMEDVLKCSFQPTVIKNDKEYKWYYSQHNTGVYSNSNCAIASVAMINKWKNENYTGTVESLRKEFRHSGDTPIYMVKDYLAQNNIANDYIKVNDFEGSKEELDKGNILLLTVDGGQYYLNNSPYKHSIIVYGYDNTNKDKIKINVQDPWVDSKYVYLEDILRGIKGHEYDVIKVGL